MDDLHKVEEHQARVKRAIARNAAVFALLLLCAKHEVETVLAVVFDRRGFVVGIHDKIATSGLVLIIDEPALDAVHKLRAYMSAHIAAVYAEASDKDGWVYHVAFGLRYGFADTFSAGVREMVCEYAGVGDCKCADDFARIVNFKTRVCQRKSLCVGVPCVARRSFCGSARLEAEGQEADMEDMKMNVKLWRGWSRQSIVRRPGDYWPKARIAEMRNMCKTRQP